jgi:phosphoribosylformylglycinamidine synthase subunit PurL
VTGAEPIGLTDCLNFGSPERPEIMDQFARAVDGMAAACKALDVPIVSGNVSLYNETDGRAILPTPTIGAVGLLEKAEDVVTASFKRAGDTIVLLGALASGALGGSEYVVAHTGKVQGPLPALDLDLEKNLQRLGGGGAGGGASGSRASSRARASFRRCTTCPTAVSPSRWPNAAWPSTILPGW